MMYVALPDSLAQSESLSHLLDLQLSCHSVEKKHDSIQSSKMFINNFFITCLLLHSIVSKNNNAKMFLTLFLADIVAPCSSRYFTIVALPCMAAK